MHRHRFNGRVRLVALAASAAVLHVLPHAAVAHGFAGKRFFPATLATEDPFVADELSLPTILHQRLGASGESPGLRETIFAIDMSKRITENFGIGLGMTYKQLRFDEG